MSDFNVLWIDDSLDKVDLEIDTVKRIIEVYGYTPIFKFVDKIDFTDLEDSAELMKNISSRAYDLLFIDYRLSEKLLGSQVIGEIRKNNNIYVDIVFYSSDKDKLLAEITDSYNSSLLEYIDDVHIVPLDDTDFEEKINRIISKIVHSWYNVNTIRGIILSRVSGLELRTNELISKYYKDKLPSIKSKLQEKSLNVAKTTKGKWDKVNKEEDPISYILNDPINFNWTIKKVIIQTLIEDQVFAMQYWNDIVDLFNLRNDFAHNLTQIENGHLVLLKGKESKIYDENQVEMIRKALDNVEKELISLISG